MQMKGLRILDSTLFKKHNECPKYIDNAKWLLNASKIHTDMHAHVADHLENHHASAHS